ncbi:SDR family oxidoreductase [Granulicella sp. 5B5]|uniref:SDR family oxidoreductase n=1 Tax=Granulicella sp. 5B5 TaxID=1617967 RepID=UPI0015F70524|nr:SDR family oxidoreductase [Granulicella sp. 5B5]QMV17658.1 SDR family oxidoreductase [Granulicella sp. 5B5]
MSISNTTRTVLVTGASRGLGAAIALELAATGAHVAVNYFNSAVAAEGICQQITAYGGRAVAFKADVRDEDEVARLVQEVEASLGTIDILVINATGPQPFQSIEEQTWRSHLDQLEFFVKSPLLLLKAVLPGMKQRGFGRVINIGSEVFELGNPRFANYVAAKGAQLGLTRSWARELAPFGITVNLVAPGWIPVERHVDAPQREIDAYTAGVPMQHMGLPVDVAKAVAFLASDGAGFITGQSLAVNGGNTLN